MVGVGAHWSLVVGSPPAVEPVDIDEAADHLREDGDGQDALIGALIAAVRAHQEQVLGLALITQTLVLRLDHFPCHAILLPRAPVQSVTAIAYVDEDGLTQTLDAELYTVDTASRPARVVPAYGESWPSTRDVPNAVTITFVAGYGATAAAVPGPLRRALLMRVADMYENREAKILGTIVSTNEVADQLETPYRMNWF